MKREIWKKGLFVVGLLTFLISCGRIPKEVEETLLSSGKNRIELEKVIAYYKDLGDQEKLKAAYFLIKNMKHHFSYEGGSIEEFDAIFEIIDSLNQRKIKINYTDDLRIKWDSLIKIYGPPSKSKSKIVYDYTNVKADFLIENIDWAFKIKDSTLWGRKLSFVDFCEYVLPYRLGTERLESWRPYLYTKNKIQRDTTTAQNLCEYTQVTNHAMSKYLKSNKIFWSYPFDIPVSKFEKSFLGACVHHVNYTTLMMRANGIPVCTDRVFRWANKRNGHEWNVVLKEDGKWHPFDAANPLFSVEYDQDRWIAKVFRKSFSPNTNILSLPNNDEIPLNFYDPTERDVTHEYKKTFHVNIPLIFSSKTPKKYSVICTFDNSDWSPVYFGKILGKHAVFNNMGGGVMYMAQYYSPQGSEVASKPFLLDTTGKITYFDPTPNRKQDLILTRKYPLTFFMKGMMGWMVNCSFEASSDSLFKLPVQLYKIDKLPENFTSAVIREEKKYRYIRFFSPKKKGERGANVAELEFYGMSENGKDTIKLNTRIFGADTTKAARKGYNKMFDGDLLSFFEFSNDKKDWIGVDFGKPCKIVKVKYCPRNDVNFIEPGHTYELNFWKDNRWISLGSQLAKDQYLKFKQVPSNTIYILHDQTKGKEERIFTYKDGKQLFW